jgi:hypothetical protein
LCCRSCQHRREALSARRDLALVELPTFQRLAQGAEVRFLPGAGQGFEQPRWLLLKDLRVAQRCQLLPVALARQNGAHDPQRYQMHRQFQPLAKHQIDQRHGDARVALGQQVTGIGPSPDGRCVWVTPFPPCKPYANRVKLAVE